MSVNAFRNLTGYDFVNVMVRDISGIDIEESKRYYFIYSFICLYMFFIQLNLNRKLKGIFDYGKQHSPYIIFFDEIDAIENLVNYELINEMNELNNNPNNKIIVIAATNNIETLSQNLRSVFKKTFFFDIPTPNERSIMIDGIIKKSGNNISQSDLQPIIDKTEGYYYLFILFIH
jgi:Cdc6-like AAA superfamily ATPase